MGSKSQPISYYEPYGGVTLASGTVSWTWTSTSDTSTTVTVNLSYCNAQGWRIKRQGAIGNDGVVASGSPGQLTDSFTATKGQTYVFQVNHAGNMENDGNGVFTVDFVDDSGNTGGNTGGSTGGGTTTDSTVPTTLWICATAGTTLTVNRVSITDTSGSQGSYVGKLTNPYEIDEEEDGEVWYGFKIWCNECFTITAKALDGYTIDTYEYSSGGVEKTFDFYTDYLRYDIWNDEWSHDTGLFGSGEPEIYSSATPNEYKLSISESAGSHVKVTRTSSNHEDASINTQLQNNDAIYHDDQLLVEFTSDTGYDMPTHTINGTEFNSGSVYTVTGNTSIIAAAKVKTYSLTLNPDTGVTITVNRTSSPLQGASNKTFTSSEFVTYANEIYYNDVLKITFSSGPEYKILNQLVNQVSFVSGSSHTVTGDVEATAITDLSGIVHIFNGSAFDNYVIYIFNGQNWNDQYIPYVFDGTKWVICS